MLVLQIQWYSLTGDEPAVGQGTTGSVYRKYLDGTPVGVKVLSRFVEQFGISAMIYY
jgi:hypothetical protein